MVLIILFVIENFENDKFQTKIDFKVCPMIQILFKTMIESVIFELPDACSIR